MKCGTEGQYKELAVVKWEQKRTDGICTLGEVSLSLLLSLGDLVGLELRKEKEVSERLRDVVSKMSESWRCSGYSGFIWHSLDDNYCLCLCSLSASLGKSNASWALLGAVVRPLRDLLRES